MAAFACLLTIPSCASGLSPGGQLTAASVRCPALDIRDKLDIERRPPVYRSKDGLTGADVKKTINGALVLDDSKTRTTKRLIWLYEKCRARRK